MQNQDLWKVLNESKITQSVKENANGMLLKWKMKADKTIFALEITANEDVLEHVPDA